MEKKNIKWSLIIDKKNDLCLQNFVSSLYSVKMLWLLGDKASLDLPLFSNKCIEVNLYLRCLLQSNLNGSNTDGSFTMANSNSFFSPYEILPIAQENKYLRNFSYFIVNLYVVCTH